MFVRGQNSGTSVTEKYSASNWATVNANTVKTFTTSHKAKAVWVTWVRTDGFTHVFTNTNPNTGEIDNDRPWCCYSNPNSDSVNWFQPSGQTITITDTTVKYSGSVGVKTSQILTYSYEE